MALSNFSRFTFSIFSHITNRKKIFQWLHFHKKIYFCSKADVSVDFRSGRQFCSISVSKKPVNKVHHNWISTSQFCQNHLQKSCKISKMPTGLVLSSFTSSLKGLVGIMNYNMTISVKYMYIHAPLEGYYILKKIIMIQGQEKKSLSIEKNDWSSIVYN